MAAPSAPQWQSAGCKLNLFLHINGRRDDGYHELQTYFQLLEYGDELAVDTDVGDEIRVDWVAGDEDLRGRPFNPGDDLLYRAATRLREAAIQRDRWEARGAHITLRKHVPVGGGLGGGSATAARLLLELNRRWAVGLTTDELAELGRHLGADVPVFLRGASSVAHGIGEDLRPAAIPTPPTAYLVLVPARTSSTSGLFASPDLVRDTPKQSDETLLSHWRDQGHNAFEPVLFAQDPELAALHAALADRAGFARVTGTGACLFAPVDTEEAGRAIGADIQADHPLLRRFFVTRPVSTANQSFSGNAP